MITLAAPTLAAPNAAITLPDVEQLPATRPTRGLQAQYQTDAGAVVIYDFGGQVSVWTMRLYPLTKTQADAIVAFFLSPIGAGGVAKRGGAWQLRDSHNVIYNVRFAMDVIELQQRTVGTWEIALTVRVI